MVEFSFYLSREDTDRLFAIKKLQGRDELTGNDFAKLLLEREVHYLFPGIPEFDEAGEVLNKERYRGPNQN